MRYKINSWRRTLVAATGAIVFGVVSAQAQEKLPTNLKDAGGIGALIAKAKKEGTVLFYSASGQDKMAAWTKDFEQKYDIAVQIYRAPSNQVFQRFAQEQQVGHNQADVMAISIRHLLKYAIGKNYIANYLPQTASKFPKGATIPGYSYPMYVTVQAVGWNTRMVPKDLQEKLDHDPLQALLDPRLKGKIAMVSVKAGEAQVAASANLIYNQADKYGWAYMKKLAAQNPAVVRSTTNLLTAVIAGDYWASPDANPSVFAPKVLKGAPLAFASPKIASESQFYLIAAIHAPHPYAARLFMEWATSLEAQSLLANIAESAVLIEGWKDTRKISQVSWYHPPEQPEPWRECSSMFLTIESARLPCCTILSRLPCSMSATSPISARTPQPRPMRG